VNILWVIKGRLLPVDSGGRIRSTNTIRELSKRHNLTVLSFYRARRPDLAYEAALAAEFPSGEACWLGNGVRAALHYRFPGRLTEALAQDFAGTARARRKVLGIAHQHSIDVAVCDFLFAAPEFPSRLPFPAILHEHNVESAALASASRLRGPTLPGLLRRWSISRLRRYEAAQLRRFEHTLAVSEDDARRLRLLAPGAAVTAIGTGVDLGEYSASPLPDSPEPLVVFTGMMSYWPNVDGVVWFVSEIWPRILHEVPAARFRIVGRDPSPVVRGLAGPSVEVTGRVESVSEHLRQASLVVIPIRFGGGTRLKVYEALASGRPTVSTRLGAEGLDVRDGHDIVLAETAADFAREAVALLKDRERAEGIARAAARTGADNSWPRVAPRIEAVLSQVVLDYRARHPAGARPATPTS